MSFTLAGAQSVELLDGLHRLTSPSAAASLPRLPDFPLRLGVASPGRARSELRAGTVASSMLELLAGALGGVIASSLFSAGLLLQAAEARASPVHGARGVRLFSRLLRRPRWVVGGVVMVVGFGVHVGALTVAPLTVVQPCLAAGLVILLIAGIRENHSRIHRREVGGMFALTMGLVALTVTAPERTTVSAGAFELAIAVGSLAATALLAHLPTWRESTRSLLATIGAGAAYALTGITTKLATDGLVDGDGLGAMFWLAVTASSAVLALVNQTAALQDRPPTEVAAFVYVMPVIIPVLLAPILVGESWNTSPGGGLPLAFSVMVVCAGAVALGGSPRVRVV